MKNVTLLTNNKVKVSTNVNNVVQMFIFPYVIFHWQICRLEEKIQICSRKCFEVPMIEEYDHRHQLYVFYFSIFMPSFHLFPVGLFPTFKFGYHQPSIGEKRKQFLPVKNRNQRVSFGIFFLNSYRLINQNVHVLSTIALSILYLFYCA